MLPASYGGNNMRHATPDQLKEIFDLFRAYPAIFLHIRQDALSRQTAVGQCIYTATASHAANIVRVERGTFEYYCDSYSGLEALGIAPDMFRQKRAKPRQIAEANRDHAHGRAGVNGHAIE
jgi:hypothetical protein